MADNLHSSTSITDSGLDKSSSITIYVSRDDNSVSRTSKDESARDSYRKSFSIFGLVVIILLLASIITNLIQGTTEPLTFQSLLSYLQDAPSVSVLFQSFEVISLQSDWGFFNFLLPVVNPLITVLNFIITFVRLVDAGFEYIFYMVGFFF